MRILSIETSCDETGISILEAKGGKKKPAFRILADNLSSQVKIHEKYGGVFPMLAKREHSKNIIPLFVKTLKEAGLLKEHSESKEAKKLDKILEREPELLQMFKDKILEIKKPKIDLIAVTSGPGLEPALWVGINFARALSYTFDIPIMPINHMEGHMASVLLPESTKKFTEIKDIEFPALSLLVSGGHTELVLVKGWMKYKKIGQTRDDAAGEAFDKVARMLGLPYPGGPQISKLAEEARIKKTKNVYTFPRPMIHSKDFDFSFSGLKTSVLYTIREILKITKNIKREISLEFENAVIETLVSKTMRATEKFNIKTVIVGGGVSANKMLRSELTKKFKEKCPGVKIIFPGKDLSVDNSIMIAIAGYLRVLAKKKTVTNIKADGNLSL